MKLTGDRLRLKWGLAIALLALVVLLLVDWSYLRAKYVDHAFSSDAILHGNYRLKRDPKATPVGVGVLMLFVAGFVCFEFKGDPPPRKDPWAEEQ